MTPAGVAAAAASAASGPEPHTRHWHRGVVQEVAPPGRLDLGPGYLEPALLPVAELHRAGARALAEYGAAALSYGEDQGALPLREPLAERAARLDGVPCGPEHVLLTAGTSQALQLIATVLARPGDVVLLDEQSYDLAQLLFTDCGLALHRLAADGLGTSAVALDKAVAGLRRAGRRPAFLYLTPTHQNPTGRTVPLSRREELLAVAAAHRLPVVEDDAYAELTLDGPPPPPSMAALAGYRGVLRLRTFSKTLAPGLRLGWLLGDPELVERLVSHGLFVSGGAVNHTTSLTVATLLRDGGFDRRLAELRAGLRLRRDALAEALGIAGSRRGERPWRCRVPGGGYFLWLSFPHGPSDHRIAALADAAGVRIARGSRFGPTGAPSVRLAFSFNPPDRLAEAGERLATGWLSLTRSR
ncbi:aminotransferase class I/II-fold pyridoxal phosphate-dependent enzyme [Kitasatospora sp. NPDC093806]|uniref:aminotransferase class I/II-fold pyridoxal phosphate-dependent enzyme n=1 Tax=Kitasatospora sp. NPDC093806 TaxID=3155075 RepID=UPI00343EDE27